MVLKNRLKTKKLAEGFARVERERGFKTTIKKVKTPLGTRFGVFTSKRKKK